MWHPGREGCVRCLRCGRLRLRWNAGALAVSRDHGSALPMWRLSTAGRYDDGNRTPENSDSEGEERPNEEVLTLQPMGSQRMAMRKRQTGQQDATGSMQAPPDPGTRGPNPCCLCWCCCCSCSWNEEGNERNRRSSYEAKADGAADCSQRPMPSAEEVLSWGQSFDRLMECPAGRCSFRDFLRTEFSEENMLFWQACEDLRAEAGKAGVEDRARLIYEDYISILSPKEVSLDSRVREVINRNMQEPTVHTFDDAQLQIYTLMQRDSYPRYISSPAYKTLLKTVSDQSPES